MQKETNPQTLNQPKRQCKNTHNNNNKCISNALNPSMTTCVRLKVLYMKHYNNTQPKLIMHYISHSIPPLPTHALMHTCTPTHSCNPSLLSLSLLVSTCLVPPLQLRGYKVGITKRPETSGHREKSAQQCHPLVPQVKKRWTQFDQLKQVGLEANHTKTHASHPPVRVWTSFTD